jgi:hypothetical protein
MAVSVHDNLLISYEVQCEARTIILRTGYRVKNEPTEFTNVIFKDVQGYHFRNDAFGNIIFGLEPVPVEEFLAEYGPEISESNRVAGSPGPWAASLEHGFGAPAGARDTGLHSIFIIRFGRVGSRTGDVYCPGPTARSSGADTLKSRSTPVKSSYRKMSFPISNEPYR